MNREEFKKLISASPDKHPSFLEYFIHFIDSVHCSYTSINPRVSAEKRDFCVTGVRQALNSYAWPTKITIPGHPNNTTEVEDFDVTFEQLSLLRNGITDCMASNGNVIPWTREILQWRMGSRGDSTQAFIENLPDASKYLNTINRMANLDGDTNDIETGKIQRYNSGMSKIHSLSSTSGLIIYDSRVAFTLGECVNSWLNKTSTVTIPEHLNFMQAGRRSETSSALALPKRYRLKRNHKWMQRNSGKWLENQMRASWLFRIALECHHVLWVEDDTFTRMHKLEAAFFMLGAYSNTLEIPPFVNRQIGGDQLEAA